MPDNSTHILIIDDNEDILYMLQAMLKLKGYKISIKENIENLELFIKNISPDIIVMDMLLSGADGREVCRRLKSNTGLSYIPIVMISAHPQGKKKCLEAGANFFLDKPFEMNDLFNAITTVSA